MYVFCVQNDSELKGRKVFMREDREDPAGAPAQRHQAPPPAREVSYQAPAAPAEPRPLSKRVVVENIPHGFGWQDLKDLAKPFGFVRRADVVHRESEGLVGIMQFERDEDANTAINRLKGQVVV